MNYSVGFNLYMNKVSCQASNRIIERAALRTNKRCGVMLFLLFYYFLTIHDIYAFGQIVKIVR